MLPLSLTEEKILVKIFTSEVFETYLPCFDCVFGVVRARVTIFVQRKNDLIAPGTRGIPAADQRMPERIGVDSKNLSVCADYGVLLVMVVTTVFRRRRWGETRRDRPPARRSLGGSRHRAGRQQRARFRVRPRRRVGYQRAVGALWRPQLLNSRQQELLSENRFL